MQQNGQLRLPGEAVWTARIFWNPRNLNNSSELYARVIIHINSELFIICDLLKYTCSIYLLIAAVAEGE